MFEKNPRGLETIYTSWSRRWGGIKFEKNPRGLETPTDMNIPKKLFQFEKNPRGLETCSRRNYLQQQYNF